MTEPTPGATETPAEPEAPGAALTDDHAQALLADAIAAAEALNETDSGEGVKFDGEYDEDRAKALIAKLRHEKAALKGSATKAAEQARQEVAQTIGKALGLISDDEPADPAKLTEQLTAASAQARDAQVALAVYQSADAANGDPVALLDSRTFRDKVKTIDPSDTAAISAAIAEAVAANPRLGKPEPVQQGMKPNRAQGASASPPLGLNEQIAAAEKAGDIRTAIRLKAGMALNTNQ